MAALRVLNSDIGNWLRLRPLRVVPRAAEYSRICAGAAGRPANPHVEVLVFGASSARHGFALLFSCVLSTLFTLRVRRVSRRRRPERRRESGPLVFSAVSVLPVREALLPVPMDGSRSGHRLAELLFQLSPKLALGPVFRTS